MRLPARFLPHVVTVLPKTGRSSTGDVYGASFEWPCMRQGGRRLVRAPDGNEVLSTLALYGGPGEADRFPPGSLVQWPGGTSTVIGATDHDDGGLGAPQHTEVACE